MVPANPDIKSDARHASPSNVSPGTDRSAARGTADGSPDRGPDSD